MGIFRDILGRWRHSDRLICMLLAETELPAVCGAIVLLLFKCGDHKRLLFLLVAMIDGYLGYHNLKIYIFSKLNKR